MAKKVQPVEYTPQPIVPPPIQCSTCRHWKRGYRLGDGTWGADNPDTHGGPTNIGVCRLNPPVVLVVPQPSGPCNISSFFPFGHEDDVCGQWEWNNTNG